MGVPGLDPHGSREERRRLPVEASRARAEVTVWRAWLPDVDGADLAALERHLTQDERTLVARFRRRRDRTRAVLARGGTRLVLGTLLGVAPRSVELRRSATGKPELPARDGTTPPLRFNCSHSGDVVMVAVTRRARVGVDVEVLRPLDDLWRVARTVCATSELTALAEVPPAEAETAFLRLWCRKEAYLKAVGAGLTRPPATVCTALDPAPRRALLSIDGDPGEAARWTLLYLSVGNGHAAALAVEAGSVDCRWRRLDVLIRGESPEER